MPVSTWRITTVMVISFSPTRGCPRRPAAPGPFWQHPQHSGWVDRRQRSQRPEWWPRIPRPSQPLSSGKDRYTLGFKNTQTTSDVQGDYHCCYLMYVCSSVLVCSSRRLLGKRPGHGRVQQRVPEAPAPVWPRTRLSGPGQVGECNVAVMREREREERPIRSTKNCRWLVLPGQSPAVLNPIICCQEKQQGLAFGDSWVSNLLYTLSRTPALIEYLRQRAQQ